MASQEKKSTRKKVEKIPPPLSPATSKTSEVESVTDHCIYAAVANPSKVDFSKEQKIPPGTLLPSRRFPRGEKKDKAKQQLPTVQLSIKSPLLTNKGPNKDESFVPENLNPIPEDPFFYQQKSSSGLQLSDTKCPVDLPLPPLPDSNTSNTLSQPSSLPLQNLTHDTLPPASSSTLTTPVAGSQNETQLGSNNNNNNPPYASFPPQDGYGYGFGYGDDDGYGYDGEYGYDDASPYSMIYQNTNPLMSGSVGSSSGLDQSQFCSSTMSQHTTQDTTYLSPNSKVNGSQAHFSVDGNFAIQDHELGAFTSPAQSQSQARSNLPQSNLPLSNLPQSNLPQSNLPQSMFSQQVQHAMNSNTLTHMNNVNNINNNKSDQVLTNSAGAIVPNQIVNNTSPANQEDPNRQPSGNFNFSQQNAGLSNPNPNPNLSTSHSNTSFSQAFEQAVNQQLKENISSSYEYNRDVSKTTPFYDSQAYPTSARNEPQRFQKQQVPHTQPVRSELDEDYLEKQGILFELQRLERKGVKLTKTFTMDDPKDHMQYELERHNMNEEAVGGVSMLKNGAKFFGTLIYLANEKLGKKLKTGDETLKKYNAVIDEQDATFEKLYRKYFKKGGSSPEWTLITALLGVFVMDHIQNAYGHVLLGGLLGTSNQTDNKEEKRRHDMPRPYPDVPFSNVPPYYPPFYYPNPYQYSNYYQPYYPYMYQYPPTPTTNPSYPSGWPEYQPNSQQQPHSQPPFAPFDSYAPYQAPNPVPVSEKSLEPAPEPPQMFIPNVSATPASTSTKKKQRKPIRDLDLAVS